MSPRRFAAIVGCGAAAALVSCLPDPPPRAVVSIGMRGGDRRFVSDDGYVVEMQRRLLVGGVSTTTSIGGGSSGGAYVRDLDVGPFDLPDIRAKDQRYVVAFTTTYYERRPPGPGVSDADLALLSGVDAGGGARTGVASFVLQGTFTKGPRTWRFDWRSSLYESVVCGRPTQTVPDRVAFPPEQHLRVDVVVRTERLFAVTTNEGADGGAPESGLLVEPFVAADADDDGIVTADELRAASLRITTGDIKSPLFDVAVDGEALVCASPGAEIPVGL